MPSLNKKKWKISSENIKAGFAQATFQGRLEIICREPLVLLDGSHNLAGVKALVQYAKVHLKEKPLTVVLGMLKDKSHKECIPQIAQVADRLITVGIDYVRGMTGEEVATEAAGFCEDIVSCATVKEGVFLAMETCRGAVLICGSLYLPGEARLAFEEYQEKAGKQEGMC